MPNIAVLTFPGNNCEVETVRALKIAGFSAEVFLWNREASQLKKFDGVVIPGGFSFEDRGRSGIVSSQEPIFQTLREMAENNTPILGICNGAQMLVESGLILADSNGVSAAGLLWNKRVDNKGNILGTGFYHAWNTVRPMHAKTPFSNFTQSLSLPIAHGEGRFTFPKEIEQEIIEKSCIVFQYVNEEGEADTHYPTNPNGSFANAAAICNPQGNVMAMMPHPERTENGDAIFDSLFQYFQNPWELNNQTLSVADIQTPNIHPADANEVTVLVRLKITDKTERTFASVLDMPELVRREKWGFVMNSEHSTEEKINAITTIIQSGELINESKQWAVVKIDGEWYDWNEGVGLEKSSPRFTEENCFAVQAKEDFKGLSKLQHLAHSLPDVSLSAVSFGVVWETPAEQKEECVSHTLFSSRVGDDIYTI